MHKFSTAATTSSGVLHRLGDPQACAPVPVGVSRWLTRTVWAAHLCQGGFGFAILGVCAAGNIRYSMSILSVAHPQYVGVTMAKSRSAAQTPSPDYSKAVVAKRRKHRRDKASRPRPPQAYSCSTPRRSRERNAVRTDDPAAAADSL